MGRLHLYWRTFFTWRRPILFFLLAVLCLGVFTFVASLSAGAAEPANACVSTHFQEAPSTSPLTNSGVSRGPPASFLCELVRGTQRNVLLPLQLRSSVAEHWVITGVSIIPPEYQESQLRISSSYRNLLEQIPSLTDSEGALALDLVASPRVATGNYTVSIVVSLRTGLFSAIPPLSAGQFIQVPISVVVEVVSVPISSSNLSVFGSLLAGSILVAASISFVSLRRYLAQLIDSGSKISRDEGDLSF